VGLCRPPRRPARTVRSRPRLPRAARPFRIEPVLSCWLGGAHGPAANPENSFRLPPRRGLVIERLCDPGRRRTDLGEVKNTSASLSLASSQMLLLPPPFAAPHHRRQALVLLHPIDKGSSARGHAGPPALALHDDRDRPRASGRVTRNHESSSDAPNRRGPEFRQKEGCRPGGSHPQLAAPHSATSLHAAQESAAGQRRQLRALGDRA
jgi:hypothetical protein